MTPIPDGKHPPIPEIPPALRPRLWRVVVRLPGNPRTGTTFGPGRLSAREAHQWLIERSARVIGPSGRRRAGKPGAPARWRKKRSHVVLSAENPLLDRGPAVRRRIQKALRQAVVSELSRTRPGLPPQPRTPNSGRLADILDALAPGILDPLAELAGPRQGFETMSVDDARAVAALTLLGAGERIRAVLDRPGPPAPWSTAEPAPRTWSRRMLAAAVDWRNARGAWPRTEDPVGSSYERRRWRARRIARGGG